jgi:hypothetical protein
MIKDLSVESNVETNNLYNHSAQQYSVAKHPILCFDYDVVTYTRLLATATEQTAMPPTVARQSL